MLNSDCLVGTGWLDRLLLPFAVAERVASVTAMTNRGTVNELLALDPDDRRESLQEILERINAMLSSFDPLTSLVEVPTGVGMCMVFHRQMLAAIGLFDPLFSPACGEENDGSPRTSRLGWKHWFAGNLFVRHWGSKSFGSEKNELLESHFALLCRKYPDCPKALARRYAAYPVAPLRSLFLLEFFARHSRKGFALVFEHGKCGFRVHRDVVGAVNRHPLAFGQAVAFPEPITYLRPGLLRGRRSSSPDTSRSCLAQSRNQAPQRTRPPRVPPGNSPQTASHS